MITLFIINIDVEKTIAWLIVYTMISISIFLFTRYFFKKKPKAYEPERDIIINYKSMPIAFKRTIFDTSLDLLSDSKRYAINKEYMAASGLLEILKTEINIVQAELDKGGYIFIETKIEDLKYKDDKH